MKPKFKSFIMAGFECTYAKAEKGKRFDLLSASLHDTYIDQDYEMIKQVGIYTVREGLSWSQIDRDGKHYDFSRFEKMMRAGKEHGIQQIWDLNHFDYPDYLDPFSKTFPKKYGEYAKRAIALIRKYQKGTLYIVPMNEPSFFAWMNDVQLWAPYKKGRGTELKRQLIRAAIVAMDAIWEEDKNVRFIQVDPFMYRQPLRTTNETEKKFCDEFNNEVRFQSWDMIIGRINPELGGDPKYLNYIGFNYYFHNQQLVGINGKDHTKFKFQTIPLESPKRASLSEVLSQVYERYKKPIVIMETGSHHDRRAFWWKYMLKEVDLVLDQKMPMYGVCSYPTLDIIKGAGFVYPKSGLWDFDQRDKTYQRIPYQPALKAIKKFIVSRK